MKIWLTLAVLKSCIATKEEPGLLYEAMFPQEQDVDTGLFDIEEERIKALRSKGVWGKRAMGFVVVQMWDRELFDGRCVRI